RLRRDSIAERDNARAPDLSRSPCERCAPSTRCRVEARRSPRGVAPCHRLLARKNLVDAELAIGTVRNHRLTGLETKRLPIDLYRDDGRLERDEIGDAPDLGIGLTIRPCGLARVTDVVVTAEPFVRTESLVFHRGQRGLIDVGAQHVPARREARLVEDDWS